nr:Fungal chitin synthase domain containing protein [Haemonchus contortus]
MRILPGQKAQVTMTVADQKAWDIFRLLPPKPDKIGYGFWHEASLQVLKLCTFVVLFILTLGSAVVAKSSFLLMTSAIGWGGMNMTICRDKIPESQLNTVHITNRLVVKWVWATFIALSAPEAFCFIRSLHRTLFKNVKRPTLIQFATVFFIETLHAIGVGILVFRIFPDLDAVTATQLTSGMCFIPAILSLLSRRPSKIALILVIIDIVAIAAQSSGFWAFPMFIPSLEKHSVAIPWCLVFISLAWWQNFVHNDSVFPPIRALASNGLNNDLLDANRFQIRISSVRKAIKDLCSSVAMENLYLSALYDHFHVITGRAIEVDTGDYRARWRRQAAAIDEDDDLPSAYNVYDNYVELNQFTSPYDALWIALVQVSAVFLCYHSSDDATIRFCFAHGFGSTDHGVRIIDHMHISIRRFLPYDQHPYEGVILEMFLIVFLVYRLPLITSNMDLVELVHKSMLDHRPFMDSKTRATCQKLFILPYYVGAFVDQSLAFNRRRDDKAKIRPEDLEFDQEENSQTYETIPGMGHVSKPPPSVCSLSSSKLENGLIRDSASSADAITKIYACATMWHETTHEMTCMLKSIFRMDEDQCARRNAQKYLKVIDPDYYEFEAHIFFDDAFDTDEYGNPVINKFVKQLVEVVDQAASAVHQTQMRLKPPKKITTPYGGRLQYILPGKNKLTVHLKDKNKIRHRKRWSQVMYLYYLLGYRLMMKVDEQARKEVISENTFILTLDGDVDFTPHCVNLLVDLMKKNKRLGAACGRIHPRGSGLMVWYQKFEYAIGHWLQKATEHMIGCVMCSPGCFSLFRSYALMDDNVTRKYASKSEEPLDYIQYDQGEDRWLCTLLLQRGYRVEYCAASDALTFAPEGFNEFFNQRRRWIPSTIANIIDLLKDYKNVVRVNESISIWYILYQTVMLISSILGPGTIFLMVVGAISISFNIDTTWSLLIVSLPVATFCIVCLTAKPEKQLLFAQIVGALFAMLMTAVFVGTSLQIQKDGILSPHAIFLFSVFGSFLTAAILHPLEFTCIIPGLLYFLAIPCMYMLLPIYSICNLNTVSWGTREDPRPQEKNDLAKSQPQKGHHLDLVNNGAEAQVDGDWSIGCGSACRLLCCLKPDQLESSPQIWRINEKLNEINKKLERIERKQQPGLTRRASIVSSGGVVVEKSGEIVEDDQGLDDPDLQLPSQMSATKLIRHRSWIHDKALRRAESEVIDPDEEHFWMDVIEKYLSPLTVDPKEQERVRAALVELRNKVVSSFFMVNVVFIIVILVLQLQKDCLHIEWPIGSKFNHTVRPCHGDTKEEIWVVTRLQLEPLGFVFLIFFMSILIIQFIAMLCHRFGTMAHIIASTELFCFRKTVGKLSEEELVIQNAVEIARELQAIRGVDESRELGQMGEQIGRRRVVQNLESSRISLMKRKTETLDAAFKKRFFALSSEATQDGADFSTRGSRRRVTLTKGTIRALENRRNSLFGTGERKHQPPTEVERNSPGAGNRGPAQRRLERLFNPSDLHSLEIEKRRVVPIWDRTELDARRF